METKKIPFNPSVIALRQKHDMYKSPVGILKESAKHDTLPENPLACFIADAVKNKAGTDIAVIDPGNISADLEKGILTESEIREAMPYKNKIVKIAMEEKNIVRALSSFPVPLQVSGLKYTLTPDKKVKGVYFEPKKDQKIYTVALDDYLLKHVNGVNPKIIEKFDWDCADATIGHIRSKHFMPFEIKPDGRIKTVD
jgi:2',3'-cyclic-nucleotide 2'-phosphodiesterase (5'-nucleotidase family)